MYIHVYVYVLIECEQNLLMISEQDESPFTV